MGKNRIILEHKGDLTFELIGEKLSELNKIMNEMAMELNSKKIMYSIMVECLENIYRHFDMDSDEIPVTNPDFDTEFILEQLDNETFVLKAGNLIWNRNVEKLREKIELVNSLNKNGLKELYKNTIREITFKNRNNAGLGIIDIAKLSGNKLDYEFKKVNDELSYFRLFIIISNIIHYKKLSIK